MSNSAQWYILVFSLFNGHVDLPGNPMPLAPESGEVKHKVFLFGNLVLFIIKRKFGAQGPHEFYAQALLELVCKNLSFIGSYAASDYLPQAAELVLAIYEVGGCFSNGWGAGQDKNMGCKYSVHIVPGHSLISYCTDGPSGHRPFPLPTGTPTYDSTIVG
jgi:hypothetical protein